jgi:hypothetical protein
MNSGPNFGRDMACLSPFVMCASFVNFFSQPTYSNSAGILWSGTFWAVEVFALAMGLLWLTVRTFDGCFDRMPDRPQRFSVWAVVVMVVAGMTGAGSVAGAVDIWIEGFAIGSGRSPSSLGILAYSVLIAIGFVLVAAELAKSAFPSWPAGFVKPPALTGPRSVLGRWWESFRLVILLASGPAVVALALATTYTAPRYEARATKTAADVEVVTYVLAADEVKFEGQLGLGRRLMVAALLLITILVHGAAAVSIGLGLGEVKGGSRYALTAAAGLTGVVIFALPIFLVAHNHGYILDSAMWSVVMASDTLLALLASRSSTNIGQTIGLVIFWDVVLTLVTVGLSWWAIWASRRRRSGKAKGKPSLAAELGDCPPAVETVLIGD